MKLLTFILFFTALISHDSSAQVVNIPKAAQDNFIKAYPNAKDVKWNNNGTNYVAKFTDGKSKFQSHYNVDGSWDFTEKQLDKKHLPANVKATLEKSTKNNWFVQSSAYIENSKGVKEYRLGIKKGITKKYVFYDLEGKEIRETVTL